MQETTPEDTTETEKSRVDSAEDCPTYACEETAQSPGKKKKIPDGIKGDSAHASAGIKIGLSPPTRLENLMIPRVLGGGHRRIISPGLNTALV